MNPQNLVAVIVLVTLLVLIFIQGGWKSASHALLIALAILVIVRLLGLWTW